MVVRYDQQGADSETVLVPTNTDSLANNTWTDHQYWLDYGTATAAVLEPGVLNVHEEMEIRIQISPKVENNTYVVVTVTSPTGVTDSVTLLV